MNAYMYQNIHITIFMATLVITSPNTGHNPYLYQQSNGEINCDIFIPL